MNSRAGGPILKGESNDVEFSGSRPPRPALPVRCGSAYRFVTIRRCGDPRLAHRPAQVTRSRRGFFVRSQLTPTSQGATPTQHATYTKPTNLARKLLILYAGSVCLVPAVTRRAANITNACRCYSETFSAAVYSHQFFRKCATVFAMLSDDVRKSAANHSKSVAFWLRTCHHVEKCGASDW